ncbi:hypothetical protein [Rhodococcus sp. NPDC058514]|uniref:hypothetical protein n=1 Tax=unclassified Rhodococcus (in: high G+C Gram-positive bacteria) TaxID=192944 RepID=UPI003646A32A
MVRIARSSSVLLLTVAGFLSVSGTAAADEGRYNYVTLGDAWSAAEGIACGGRVYGGAVYSETIQPGPGADRVDHRGWVLFSVGAAFVGLSAAPGVHCSAAATISWRNLDTGAAGSWTSDVNGSLPPFLGTGASTEIFTGSGRVEARLTTNRPHLPSVTGFTVF